MATAEFSKFAGILSVALLQHHLSGFKIVQQGKLEVVKQEMARVNVNILGIRELKWTGMGEFNSDDHYIISCKDGLNKGQKWYGPNRSRRY